MITDILKAGAMWLSQAREVCALEPVIVETEDGVYPRNATVVQGRQNVSATQVRIKTDYTTFLFKSAEVTDINFKRGVTITWDDQLYDVIVDKNVVDANNDVFGIDKAVAAVLRS